MKDRSLNLLTDFIESDEPFKCEIDDLKSDEVDDYFDFLFKEFCSLK